MIDFIKSAQPYTFAIVFLMIYAAEHVFPQRKDLIDTKHDLRNILIGLINLAVVFFFGIYFQKIIAWAAAKNIGLFHFLQLKGIAAIILQFLVIDIIMYWWHRFNHTIPFFWQFHKFHHVDTKLNATTALRFHAVELMLSFLFRLLFFVVMGIGSAAIIIYGIFYLPIIIFHHSNLRISEKADNLLRTVLVTPGMHRIHHSVLPFETRSNYSSLLPWWDLVFKTNRKKPVQEIRFGIDESMLTSEVEGERNNGIGNR